MWITAQRGSFSLVTLDKTTETKPSFAEASLPWRTSKISSRPDRPLAR
jgi:hypothetical protein